MVDQSISSKKNIEIILTHNPYCDKLVIDWDKIHNLNILDISIGVYGSLTDKDSEEKIKLIKSIYDKMNGECSFDYDTDNDSYFCSLNSKRKTKRYLLRR